MAARRHRFVYAHTLTWRGLRHRICARCGQYPQSSVHRVRGWRGLLVGEERQYAHLLLDGVDVGTVEQVHDEPTYETVTSGMPEPSPDWRWTDSAGHTHRWGRLDVRRRRLRWPGITRRIPQPGGWCDICRDWHADGEIVDVEHECAVCGEPVRPGTHIPPPQTILTSQKIMVDVVSDINAASLPTRFGDGDGWWPVTVVVGDGQRVDGFKGRIVDHTVEMTAREAVHRYRVMVVPSDG